MGYVTVPKDLKRIKSKVALGLTKRQLVCIGASAAVGVPLFFLTRDLLGNTLAMLAMLVAMVPGFALGMYERDGMPLERIVMDYLDVRRRKPAIRRKEVKHGTTLEGGPGYAAQAQREARQVEGEAGAEEPPAGQGRQAPERA